jgi:predicted DNA-binding transcriptional regulator YafY
MAQNKNALIRYKTIDKCLQNPYRKWTLEDLIDACSEALYEYEGRDINVSKRTIQLDIQLMRSDKLGYNAPIEVYDRKFYRYEDPDYSITDIPLNESDMHVLSETVEMLKQFKDFSLFSELGGIIQRLEDKVYAEKTHRPAIIHLDKNDRLKGLEHLDTLYQAILKKIVLKITYQSFKSRTASTFTYHPYILKEYNNRWFLIGKKSKQKSILTLALDRIQHIDYDSKTAYLNESFDGDEYYKNTIGVTVMDAKHVERVVIKVEPRHAPYILTKPMHHSQQVLKELDNGGVIIELLVHPNYELERMILGFGDYVQVLRPTRMRRQIQQRLENGLEQYKSNLSKNDSIAASRLLKKHGYSVLENLYTKNEVREIGRLLHHYFQHSTENSYGKRTLLKDIPQLKALLFSENLKNLVQAIDKDAFLTKAIYFDKPHELNWYVTWHQDVPINVLEKVEEPGYSAWTNKNGVVSVCPPEDVLHNIFTVRIHLDATTSKNGALKVIPRSHHKRFTDGELREITQKSNATLIELNEGGVQLMKPLLLHASAKSSNQKRRRVIHLEFASKELPGKLEWLEKELLN